MSKRWKVRKRNAAKLQKSREVLEQFYDNVVAGLEKMKESVALKTPATGDASEAGKDSR